MANKIRLLRLLPLVKKILSDNNLTERHARALKAPGRTASVEGPQDRLRRGLNVKRTEELIERVIDKYLGQSRDKPSEKEADEDHQGHPDICKYYSASHRAYEEVRSQCEGCPVRQREYIEFIVRVPKA